MKLVEKIVLSWVIIGGLISCSEPDLQDSNSSISPVVTIEKVDLLIEENQEIKDSIVEEIFNCESDKFLIKVDKLSNGKYSYRSWNRPIKATETPDLELVNGEVNILDTDGGISFIFQNNDWTYVVENHPRVATKETKGIYLKLYQNDVKKMNIRLSKVGQMESDALKEALYFCSTNWSLMRESADLSVENIHSIFPERGVRVKYEILKPKLGKKIIEKIIGEDVFVSGPHTEEVDYQSIIEFGNYNPIFLNKLKNTLTQVLEDKQFVAETKVYYDAHFLTYLRAYYITYSYTANKHEYVIGLGRNDFWPLAQNLSREGFDLFEVDACAKFWVRRTADGTAGQFYKILSLVMKKYDTVFFDKEDEEREYEGCGG